MSGMPLEGSKPERGYPDLNGSTIIPPPPRDLRGGEEEKSDGGVKVHFISSFITFSSLNLGFRSVIIWLDIRQKFNLMKRAKRFYLRLFSRLRTT